MTFIMCIWGFNVSAIKILVDYFPPLSITSLRIFTAGVTVFVILAFMKKLRKPKRNEYKYLLLGGLLNIGLHHCFLSIGLIHTTATNGGLILGSVPLLTAIFSSIFLKKLPNLIQVLGFLIGSTGILLIVFSGSKGLSYLSFGDLYVFLSVVVQALSFIVISKIAKTMDTLLLTGYMLIIGSFSLVFISIPREFHELENVIDAPLSIWMVFFLSAILATAFCNIIYNLSISKIGVTESAIFLNLEPFFSIVGATIFLNEHISMMHIFGLLFIVSGILLGSRALEELIARRRQVLLKHKRYSDKNY
jgi:drug/metabolite transporter (DMT)-like permease